MPEIRWEFYPLVAQHELARTWLTMQRNLQLAPATIDAYGRNLNDYLAFCSKHRLLPETLTREALALYVQDLATRANPRGPKIVSIGSGCGLSRATMQQRITVIRLYYPTGCATSCTSRVKWLERVFDGIRGFCDEEALLRNYKQARMEQREIAGSGQRIFTLMIPSEGWYDISSRNCSVCEFLLD